ncbi:MAG: sensor histidine kinase, partial [Phenylobacterium sp.]
MDRSPWSSLSTIRVRLIAALAIALLPVLLLGGVQSALAFNREEQSLRESLAFAAERSAATARARMESADILLRTLGGGAVGFDCPNRLAEVARRVPGYLNLIRFDRLGRVSCAAQTAPADPQRAQRPWFRRLAAGEDMVITRAPGADYAREPAVIAAARASRPDGAFDGAQAAVISLASLHPRVRDPAIPSRSQVALADASGAYISTTDASAFPRLTAGWRAEAAKSGYVWYGRDQRGDRRVYSAAPILGQDVFVILSAASPSLFSWARLNPLTGL